MSTLHQPAPSRKPAKRPASGATGTREETDETPSATSAWLDAVNEIDAIDSEIHTIGFAIHALGHRVLGPAAEPGEICDDYEDVVHALVRINHRALGVRDVVTETKAFEPKRAGELEDVASELAVVRLAVEGLGNERHGRDAREYLAIRHAIERVEERVRDVASTPAAPPSPRGPSTPGGAS